MRSLSVLLMTAVLSACAVGPEPGRTADAQAHLDKILAGKVAGTPISCLAHSSANDMDVIDDGTVVFTRGRTVYRNDFSGGSCNELGRGHYALVTRTSSSSLCRGDIAEVRDFSNGITVGSCVLGDFVPYTTPRA